MQIKQSLSFWSVVSVAPSMTVPKLTHARLPYQSRSLSHPSSTLFLLCSMLTLTAGPHHETLSRSLSLSLFCEPPWLFFWFATTTSHRHAVGHIILHHQIPGLPSTSVARISRGDAGIDEVTRSLCHVNVADARAFDPRDEQKVKTTIQSTVPSLIEFCCDWCDWYGW